jgi:hypothetical protein
MGLPFELEDQIGNFFDLAAFVHGAIHVSDVYWFG